MERGGRELGREGKRRACVQLSLINKSITTKACLLASLTCITGQSTDTINLA